MRGRKKSSLKISDEDRKTLTSWANADRTEQRMAKRAKVILGLADGLLWREICGQSGFGLGTCIKWGTRYRQDGLDGLYDQPRTGAPRTISPSQRNQVIALACSKPEDGSNQWSTKQLARKCKLGKTTVHRILNEGKIKPHKIDYWCGKSTDPEFARKQAEIIGLYMNPPENAMVICVDEKSQMQVLDRRQPELPMLPGKARRQTCTYVRHGTVCLMAALAVHEGSVTGKCVDRNDSQSFLRFLKHLYRKFTHCHLHVIIDNLNTHRSEDVKKWLSRRQRISLHFTPTYSSWLNQIEIWFNIFSRDVVKGGIWSSKQQMIDQIMHYIRHYNQERARPFSWTYTGKPLTV